MSKFRFRTHKINSPKKQNGAALLLFILLLVVGATTLLVSKINKVSTQHYRDEVTVKALVKAKVALIGYGLIYGEDNLHEGQPHGYLPCPDINSDGLADTPCEAIGESVIGRLPWKTLRIEPLQDSSGECLWYAVSGIYKATQAKSTITNDSSGMFVIQDSNGSIISADTNNTRIIAAIFSPGEPLSNQDRTLTSGNEEVCGSSNSADNTNQAGNYLDSFSGINNSIGTSSSAGSGQAGENPLPTTSNSIFITAPRVVDTEGNVLINDNLLTVSRADFDHVYSRMDQWIGARVQQCLNSYRAIHPYYPWASSLASDLGLLLPDLSGERLGRIPQVLANTQTDGGNLNSDSWPTDPNDSDPPLQDCFNEFTNRNQAWGWWWWDEWKELVIYGIDEQNSPLQSGSLSPQLDGTLVDAVVLVSGKRFPAQSRETNSEKGDFTNYLESENFPGSVPPYDEDFVSSSNTASEFNDVAVCIGAGCP